jgi:hypothetical protein
MRKSLALCFSGLCNLFSRNNYKNKFTDEVEDSLVIGSIKRIDPNQVEEVLFNKKDSFVSLPDPTKASNNIHASSSYLSVIETIETRIRGLSPSIAGSIELSPAPFDRDSKRPALAPSPEAGSHNNSNQSYLPAKPFMHGSKITFMHGPNLADNSSNPSLKADSPAKLSEDKTHTATASPILYDNHNKIRASDILEILNQRSQEYQPSQTHGSKLSIDENSEDSPSKPVANLQINIVGTDIFTGRISKPSTDVRRFGGVEFQGRGFQAGNVAESLGLSRKNSQGMNEINF